MRAIETYGALRLYASSEKEIGQGQPAYRMYNKHEIKTKGGVRNCQPVAQYNDLESAITAGMAYYQEEMY